MLCPAGFIMSRALDFQCGSLTDYANHVLGTFQCTKNMAIKKKQFRDKTNQETTCHPGFYIPGTLLVYYFANLAFCSRRLLRMQWKGFAFPAEKGRRNSHHKPTSPSIRALTSENSTLWVLSLSPGNGISPSQRPVKTFAGSGAQEWPS